MLYRAYTKANIVPLTAPYFPAPTFGITGLWYTSGSIISHSTPPNRMLVKKF